MFYPFEINSLNYAVNQEIDRRQPMIQRGIEDAIYNPNNHHGAPRITHNLNEFGNGQGMISGILYIAEYSYYLGLQQGLNWNTNLYSNSWISNNDSNWYSEY